VWVAGAVWLTPALDSSTVELACRTLDDIVNLRTVIAKHGSVLEEPISTPSGKIVGTRMAANPAVKMLRDAERQYERWLIALSIPPGARASLGWVQVKAEGKLDALMATRLDRQGRPSGG
jgi:hypothetical protein